MDKKGSNIQKLLTASCIGKCIIEEKKRIQCSGE